MNTCTVHGIVHWEFPEQKIASVTLPLLTTTAVTSCAAGVVTTRTTSPKCHSANANFTGAVRSDASTVSEML